MLHVIAALLVLVAAAPARATYSIVARDPATGELGVAVASRVLGVGSLVPGARAGVGAIASQAFCNPSYGDAALAMLAGGKPPAAVLAALTAGDADREHRQVGVLDARGQAAAYTGKQCLSWAGHRTGDTYALQGNILTGPAVLDAMETAFNAGAGPLAARLLAALAAGEEAGGDSRGRQSAALLVVAQGKGYAGLSDRMHDLRVDDAEHPVAELARLYHMDQALKAGLHHTGGKDLEGRELIGTPAPALPASGWYSGEPPTQGKVLLVRFWTVGCSYCTRTMPALEEMSKHHREKGLVVVGIHHPKGPAGRQDAVVKKTATDWGVSFPIAQDLEWKALEAWWMRGRKRSFTSATLLVDRRGTIRFAHRGGEFHPSKDVEHKDCDLSHALMEVWVRRLLAE